MVEVENPDFQLIFRKEEKNNTFFLTGQKMETTKIFELIDIKVTELTQPQIFCNSLLCKRS